MAGNLPAHGSPLIINDLITKASESDALNGHTVRITGKLHDHDYHRCLATIVDPQTGARINMDTRLIEPFDAKIGSLFQVIGEVDCGVDKTSVTLKAHVIRCVDGIDLIMYKKALEAQRQYLQNR